MLRGSIGAVSGLFVELADTRTLEALQRKLQPLLGFSSRQFAVVLFSLEGYPEPLTSVTGVLVRCPPPFAEMPPCVVIWNALGLFDLQSITTSSQVFDEVVCHLGSQLLDGSREPGNILELRNLEMRNE